jgi:hypothetical protein
MFLLFIREKLQISWINFNKILRFLCELAKSSVSFSKSMLRSSSAAKTHKFHLISDIVSRAVVLISFILRNVLSHVVDETGILIPAATKDQSCNRSGSVGTYENGWIRRCSLVFFQFKEILQSRKSLPVASGFSRKVNFTIF